MQARFPRKRLAAAFAAALLVGGCGSEPSRAVRTVSSSPAKAPAASRPSYGETYVVAPGDTLFSIAFRNQLDYHDIADWNGIGRDYTIYPGRVLRLTPLGSPSLPPDSGQKVPASSSAGNASAVRTIPPPVIPPSSGSRDSAKPESSAPTGASAIGSAGGGNWEWPTRGKLLRGYDGSANKGLDIGGEVGQIVIASRAGKVVYSGSALKGYGELIIIKHDEETLSAYGYNRRRLVEEGESVVGGQPIAELGLGPEQRPLLHFEVRDHGKPVDPKPLLPRR